MSEARFNGLFNGLNSSARKVFEAIPISEGWHITRIVAEINRKAKMDYRIITGCLTVLREAKLIRESPAMTFQRTEIRQLKTTDNLPTEEAMKKPESAKPAAAPQAAAPVSPMDKLGSLAQRVNLMTEQLKQLATDIVDAAIEIQAEQENSKKGLELLSQFQALMKSAGVSAVA